MTHTTENLLTLTGEDLKMSLEDIIKFIGELDSDFKFTMIKVLFPMSPVEFADSLWGQALQRTNSVIPEKCLIITEKK